MRNIRIAIEAHPVLFSLALSVILFVLPAATGVMKYEVSDDFMMELIVSGQYGGTPSPYIMFMSPLLGQMFAWLYAAVPGFNWYVWFQISLMIISSTVLMRNAMVSQNTLAVVSTFALVLLLSLDGYQLMQFTKTACFCMCAGFSLFYCYFIRGGSKGQLVLGTVLLVAGSLIRFAVFAVVAPLYALIVVFRVIEARKDKKALIRCGICIILGAASIGSVLVVRKTVDLGDGYDTFKTYSDVRAEIVDYPHPEYEELKDELQAIGIDENEYSMVFNWLFSDPDGFDLKQMEDLRDVLREHRAHKSGRQAIRNLLHQRYWWYLGFWCCVLVFVLLLYTSPKLWWKGVALGMVGILLMFYNAYQGRLVYRVEFTVFFAVACVITELQTTQRNAENLKNKGIITLCVLLSLLRAFFLIPGHEESKYDILNYSWANDLKKYRCAFRPADYEAFNAYMDEHDGVFYLDFNTGIQNYYLSFPLMQSLPEDAFEKLVYVCGVDYLNPARIEKTEKLGVTGTMDDLLDEGVYLVDNGTVDSIVEYMGNKLSVPVRAEFMDEVDGFKIWTLRAE